MCHQSPRGKAGGVQGGQAGAGHEKKSQVQRGQWRVESYERKITTAQTFTRQAVGPDQRCLRQDYQAAQGWIVTAEQFSSVYDALVTIGGAPERGRVSFIYHHTSEEYPCTEWRFSGHLGCGGKYRSKTNTVDCYSEDETPTRTAIIADLNSALEKLQSP